jgi:hypothetical protein
MKIFKEPKVHQKVKQSKTQPIKREISELDGKTNQWQSRYNRQILAQKFEIDDEDEENLIPNYFKSLFWFLLRL